MSNQVMNTDPIEILRESLEVLDSGTSTSSIMVQGRLRALQPSQPQTMNPEKGDASAYKLERENVSKSR